MVGVVEVVVVGVEVGVVVVVVVVVVVGVVGVVVVVVVDSRALLGEANADRRRTLESNRA